MRTTVRYLEMGEKVLLSSLLGGTEKGAESP